MKTRAVVFPEANRFEVRELTLPEPGPDDIVVRTLVTAISPGTERWILRGKHIGTQFPCVPGYHRIGIVEKCGNKVSHFQDGDIVYGSAGHWEEAVHSMWGAHVDNSVGKWTDYSFVASSMPTRLEMETLSFSVLTEVANRGIRFLAPQPGQTLIIIGAGFVGICAAQLAMLIGAVPVLLEKDPERLAFVRELIPDVLSPDDGRLEENLGELAPGGFDFLYDTVGHAPTTDRMVKLMRRQGTMLLQAQYFDREKCAIDLDQIKIKELTVKTTCGTDSEDRLATMNNIRARRLKIAPLITHRFQAKDILKGYELLHTGKPFNLGIVFHWEN